MAIDISEPVALPNEGNVVLSKEKSHVNGKHTSAVLHRNLHAPPRRVVGSEGIYIILDDGRRILDATAGAAVASIGHNNARVKEALKAQADEISYCHSLFFNVNAQEALGSLLVESTGNRMTKAWVCSSGSEAMEAALKLGRQYFMETVPPQPQRTRFIGRREGYHGVTLGSLSAGGHKGRRALYEPLLSTNTSHVSPCNAYRGQHDGESDEQYVARLKQELDDEFQRVGPSNVIAFVAEPVVGAASGCVPALPGYFLAMKEVCDKYGALLILDEIMSGMGRSGTLHAWEQEGVVPDIQTIAKGLGGGYAPVAAILINKGVVDVLDRGSGAFMHGQTYQGHPIACAAAAAVINVIKEDRLVENCAAMGKVLERGLKERLADHPNVGNIRGKGLFWGIELVKDKATKQPFDPKETVAMSIHEHGMEKPFNVSLYPANGVADGTNGDVIMISPPYIVTKEEVEKIVDLVDRVIRDFFEKQGNVA